MNFVYFIFSVSWTVQTPVVILGLILTVAENRRKSRTSSL